MRSSGFKISFGETWRHPETAKYMAKTGKGVSKSFHIDRLAIDINLFKEIDGRNVYLSSGDEHRMFGEYWKSLDSECTWGGDFRKPDPNHYSYGEH